MARFTHQILATSEATTKDLAEQFAVLAEQGDCFLLFGQIGAGKSLFARAFIQKRLRDQGRLEDVPSPTFTLVQTYDDGISEFWHADLYRVTNDGELDELGLIEAMEQAVTLIEWPDRVVDLAPKDAVSVSFETNETPDERIVTFAFDNPKWEPLFHSLGVD